MDVFTAIAEPTRRSILEALATQGSLTSSTIAERFRVTPSAVSQHLRILRKAKLVRMEKRAQQRIYTINPSGVIELEAWMKDLSSQWTKRLDSLDSLLAKDKEANHGRK